MPVIDLTPLRRGSRLVVGGLRSLGAVATGRKALLSVTYHVTYRCNLRCVYCPVPHHGPELSGPEALDVIRAIAGSGAVRLGLSGGDPLLRMDLDRMIETARSLGMIVSVTTNGILLEERLDLVRNTDVLFVSLDGLDGGNALRHGGTPSQQIRGIEAARRQGLEVSLICVLSRTNIATAMELIGFAESVGAQVVFQPLLPGSDSFDATDDPLLDETLDRLIEAKLSGRPVANSVAYLRALKTKARGVDVGDCPAGRFVAVVLPDGSASACCEHAFGDAGKPLGPRDGPLSLRLGALVSPSNCDTCRTVGNAEIRRLTMLDPTLITDTLRLLR